MARTITRARQVQMGRQTVWDTPVASTAKYPTNMSFTEESEKNIDETPQGIRGPINGQITTVRGGVVGTMQGDLTFEEMITFLAMTLKGGVTPTGAGAEKTWTYTAPMSSDPAPNPYTQEFRLSDFVAEYLRKVPNCLGMELTINIPLNGMCTYNLSFFGGTPVIGGASTAALNLVSQRERIKGNAFKLFIDTTGANIGTTQKTDTLIGAQVKINGGIRPDYAMDGRTANDMSGYRIVDASCEVELTYKSNALANAELIAWRADTTRFVRLRAEGTVIPTTAITRKLTFDMCLMYSEGGSIDDDDGSDVLKLTASNFYDPTWAKSFEVVSVNGLATAP